MKKYQIYKKNTDKLLYTGVGDSGLAVLEFYEEKLKKDIEINLFDSINAVKRKIERNRKIRKAGKEIEEFIKSLPEQTEIKEMYSHRPFLGDFECRYRKRIVDLKPHNWLNTHFAKLLTEFIADRQKASSCHTDYCRTKGYLEPVSYSYRGVGDYANQPDFKYKSAKYNLKVEKVFLEVKNENK